MKGIVICVNFDDLLSITLPRNLSFLDSCLVVTSPQDERTQHFVKTVDRAECYVTDAFYRNGATFNKGLAMEEGFDVLGRDGWILIWDADTLFPSTFQLPYLDPENLYNAPRRLMEHPDRDWPNYANERWWDTLPICPDRVFPGYFQLFNASCSYIRERPWYDVTFTHAGGGDGYFQSRWPNHKKQRLDFEVLHFGPRDRNWFGRTMPRTDGRQVENQQTHQHDMENFLGYKGWSPNCHSNDEYLEEHVPVEGYQPSGFKLIGKKDR